MNTNNLSGISKSTDLEALQKENQQLKSQLGLMRLANEKQSKQLDRLVDQVYKLTQMLSEKKELNTMTVEEFLSKVEANKTYKMHLSANALKTLPEDQSQPVTAELVQKMIKSIVDSYTCNNTKKIRLVTLGAIFKDYPQFQKVVSAANSSIKKESSEAIALTDLELKLFQAVETTSINEAITKDLFLIACYTGMRISDVFTIKPENINGNYLTYTSHKTKCTAQVPIQDWIVKLIFDAQNYDLYDKSEGTLRATMKRILPKLCRKVWDENKKLIFKGGKLSLKDRAAAVSPHTGRRTFATMCSRKGIPEYTIQKMMGHSSIEMTRKYIKGYVDTDTENKLLLGDYGYEE